MKLKVEFTEELKNNKKLFSDTYDMVVKYLNTDAIEICFEKVNSSEERVMTCTLSGGIIPVLDQKPLIPGFTAKKAKNEDVQVVWDCDKEAWRSFRKKNILWARF